jgi:hypothetical protein
MNLAPKDTSYFYYLFQGLRQRQSHHASTDEQNWTLLQ